MSTTTVKTEPPPETVPSRPIETAGHLWYALEPREALGALGSSEDGLGAEEAAARLAQSGPNALPQPKGEHPLLLLWRQVNNPLIGILIASGVLALALGKGTDGLVVLGVVALNAVVGFVQEFRAGRAIRALDDLVSETASVLRGGRLRVIPAADLVPGD